MQKLTNILRNRSAIVPIVLGVVFTAGVTYAWDAVWHGTDWITDGETIRAQEIAEDFEYLKQRMDYVFTLIESSAGGLAWRTDAKNNIPPNSGDDWLCENDYELDPSGWTDTGAHPFNVAVGSAVAVIGEYVYMFGGQIPTQSSPQFTDRIIRAPVSDPTAWVDTGANLPSAMSAQQSVVIDEYVYLFGGWGLGDGDVIYRAPVSNPTNVVDTGATLPDEMVWGTIGIIGDYVYHFGGYDFINGYSDSIYRAPLTDPTAWVDTGATLPTPIITPAFAVIDDYAYVFSGAYSGGAVNAVYRAPVSDPTNWENTGAALPTTLLGPELAVSGDYVYLFGGMLTSGYYSDGIYRAPITDPTTWEDTGITLPSVNSYYAYQHLRVVGDYIYMDGGDTRYFSVNHQIRMFRAPLTAH